MSARYGNKVGPLVARKSSFFKKNINDSNNIKAPVDILEYVQPAWVRPTDWPVMPTITSSEQKIALLVPVYPQGSNFVAFSITGAYTVDWGDGTTENVASGIKAQHEYSFDDTDLNPVSSEGYKTAIVIITPQASNNITSVNFNQKYSLTGSTFPDYSPILEMLISAPSLTSITLGSSSSAFCTNLFNFHAINIGSASCFSMCFGLRSLQNFRLGLSTTTTHNDMFRNCINLTNVSFDNSSNLRNCAFMFDGCRSLKTIPTLDLSSVSSMNNMFRSCVSLLYIPMMNTANVLDMTSAFQACNILENIPPFNTSKVTNMSYMFYQCFKLKEVPLFDTKNVLNMGSMFQQASSLITIPAFDTRNVTFMSYMFDGCFRLKRIPTLNTSKVTSFANAFQSCQHLEYIPLLDTSSATDMSNMFNGCTNLIKIPKFNTSKATSMSSMFSNCSKISEIPDLDTSLVTNMNGMFSGCIKLLRAPYLNTSKVTNMASMFQSCTSLREVPLFVTSLVTNMNSMFNGCNSLLNVPFFDTTLVTAMGSTFANCRLLSSTPLYNTGNVTNMAGMFSGCYSLQSVPLFNTIKAASMSSMFSDCQLLQTVPLFVTDALQDCSSMFAGCVSLKIVPSFNTVNVTNMTSMFNGCTNLATVNLSNGVGAGLNTVKFTTIFNNCISLSRGVLKNAEYSVSYAGCRLSKTALEEIFDNLDTIGAASQSLTITNNWGAQTPVSISGITTLGSKTINTTNTTGILVGMQIVGSGSPLSTAISVAFTDAGDLVTLNNHQLQNGDEVSFATITSTTGIVVNRIYYIVNSNGSNTFQLANTIGGAAIALTTNGSGTMRYRTEVVSVVTNTSITVSRPMTFSNTNIFSFQALKTGTALLKGWTVVG